MANLSSNWQDSLNQKLVNRLARPLRQSGMIKMAMTQRIINRCDRFLNRLPLLNQQMQRWGNNITFSSNDVPIVYAQPVSSAQEGAIASRDQNVQPTVAQNNPSVPLIQRKVDSSQTSPVQINQGEQREHGEKKNTELNQGQLLNTNSPSRSHSDEVTIINQTVTSDSEMPLVSPQAISEELESTEKLPLQAKFSDSPTTSAHPSQINSELRSHLDEVTIINQTATAEEAMPKVSPQAISEELESTEKLPLQAKFSDSPTASANPSQINPNPRSRSHTDEGTIINNQTATSDSEIPLVSPQAIFEELESTEQLPLKAKSSDSPTASANPSQINPNPRSRSHTDEGTIINNQTAASDSEMLLVSPQAISEELESTEKLPLKAKSSDSQTASVHSSQINSNPRSHLDEGTIINQTATSDSEMPKVSPQTISEELESTEKLPLQAKFSDSPTTSANPSQINPNPRSHPDEDNIINQTATSDSEMPKVSPQAISEELESREKLPLQAKISDSQTTSAHPSQINSHPRSHPDEVTIINQTATADSEIPVVSPQIISERLTKNEEISLVLEFTSNSQQPLPIIQAKRQNSSRSSSSFPIVNPSNTLVTPKPTQQDNYDPEKSSSIKYKKSNVEFPAQEFPLETVQPLTSPINLTEEKVRNTTNYQNQLFYISQSQINQNNNNQNISTLPIVPVTSQINSSLQTRSSPLPLANNTPLSNSISQKPNISNQNSRGSNTANFAASSPKIFASPSPPTQTFVSAMETQPKIDLDAITSQVEKKIMRRLVIESERRGKIR